jgi:hypothetical protein
VYNALIKQLVASQIFLLKDLQKKIYTLYGKCTNFPLLIAAVKILNFLGMKITGARGH